MRVLLDTQAWIWLTSFPGKLSEEARALATDRSNELVLSVASSWEIAIKHRLGKLELPEEPATYIPSRMETFGMSGIPVEHHHALEVASLPLHHRDPFDRILVAQARIEGMTILTSDPAFAPYDVDVLHAG